jgi:hypothetical protein
MATASTLNTRVDLAITAMDDADWSTALSHLLVCKLLLSTRAEQFRGEIGLRYNAQAIDQLIEQCRAQQRIADQASLVSANESGSPFVEAPILYVRG